MSDIKAEWTNKDNFSINTTTCDYISREDVTKLMPESLNNMPSDDVVRVVRCKDCIHNSYSSDHGNACCDIFYGMTDQMGFCSYGERKEQEHDI